MSLVNLSLDSSDRDELLNQIEVIKKNVSIEKNYALSTITKLDLVKELDDLRDIITGLSELSSSLVGKVSSLQVQVNDINELNAQLKNENVGLITQLKNTESLAKQNHNDTVEMEDAGENPSQQQQEQTATTTQYATDESEVERETRETDWIIKEGRKKKRASKKRKMSSSPEAGTSDQVKENNAKNKEKALKNREIIIRPPPINVTNVKEFKVLRDVIKEAIGDAECAIHAQNNNIWKIKAKTEDEYRSITTKLTEGKFQWFSYEDKNSRPIKVMARGLHDSCEKEEIIDNLKAKGFLITDATNIIKKEKVINDNGKVSVKSRKLPLFMLTFDHSESIEKIYSIKTILNIIVKIEALRKTSNKIVQCKKCQSYNHTQKFCYKEPRCVKCAGKHLSNACPSAVTTTPKCANCDEAHPANYRGCEVAKTLQKLRNGATKPHKEQYSAVVKENKIPVKQATITKTVTNPQNSDAKSVQKNKVATEGQDSIMATLNIILMKLDKQEKINEAIFKRLNGFEKTTISKKK